jgi:hypothetical protein
VVVADQRKMMELVFLLRLLVVVEFIFTQVAVVVLAQGLDSLLFRRYTLEAAVVELAVLMEVLTHQVVLERQEFYMW